MLIILLVFVIPLMFLVLRLLIDRSTSWSWDCLFNLLFHILKFLNLISRYIWLRRVGSDVIHYTVTSNISVMVNKMAAIAT